MSRHSQITHVNQSNQSPTAYIEGSEVESPTISVPLLLHQDRRRGVDELGSGWQSSTLHTQQVKNYPTTAVYSIEEIHNWVNVANNQIQTLHKEKMELIQDFKSAYSMNERAKEIIQQL